MKTIAIIGAKGTVGKTLVEFFKNLNHQVLSVDLDTDLTLEVAAAKADVVFIVTLPIKEVGELIHQAVSVMRPGTLLIHGASVESPVTNKINSDEVCSKKINFCHWHFQFRPEVPLANTLFGQHITVSGCGDAWEMWRKWLYKQFQPSQPFIHGLAIGEHDQITSVSQLFHMLTALIISKIWGNLPKSRVNMAMRICGPPGRLLIRSVLRVETGAKVAKSIICNHPHSLTVLDWFLETIQSLRTAIWEHQPEALENWLKGGQSVLEPADLKKWNESTARLSRFDSDMEEARLEFRFSREENRIGLLAKILEQFDVRGIDKTSTLAQKNPDGGCTIIIGIYEKSEAALEAERVIRSW